MIPLVNLTLDKSTSVEIKKEVEKVIDSNSYILGERLESFEKKFAKFIGTNEAIGVGNGTDALRLSLRALGIGNGDRVLTVGFTSPFTALSIIQEGAIPVFCDINAETLTIDLDDASSKLDSNVHAIMPVHIYGNPCDMKAILSFAKEHGLVVIEDAAQAIGASIGGKMTGTFGDLAAFSFYPTKNLGAMGDGGAVVTNDLDLSRKVRSLRHGGQTKRFWHEYKGICSRLDEIQAAILEVKLAYLQEDNKRREILAKRYIDELSKLPIKFQTVLPGAQSAWHLFVIVTKRRDELKDFLFSKDIVSDVYYPYPLNKQAAFKNYSGGKLPITEKLCSQVLAIPIYPSLVKKDQDYVIENIKAFFGG